MSIRTETTEVTIIKTVDVQIKSCDFCPTEDRVEDCDGWATISFNNKQYHMCNDCVMTILKPELEA